MFEAQRFCRHPQLSADDVAPSEPNPVPVLTPKVERIPQVTKAMLRPTVFMIVYALLEEDRIALVVGDEQGVAFRRNRKAKNLSLFPSFWIVVVAFDFENRPRFVAIWTELSKAVATPFNF